MKPKTYAIQVCNCCGLVRYILVVVIDQNFCGKCNNRNVFVTKYFTKGEEDAKKARDLLCNLIKLAYTPSILIDILIGNGALE